MILDYIPGNRKRGVNLAEFTIGQKLQRWSALSRIYKRLFVFDIAYSAIF